ncbi:DUF4199 domain-containing protein [Aquimarina algiphila]|uniref:DUF4199 domain-containing protein n=1 Tax=Aquimarina algiphila TaxID=2047982 RepID=UPI00232BCD98|nr:DUF4199 domain-containing protein [Aquimarina algiphila]
MEETTISTKKYILKYGIILGIISTTYSIILYITSNMINESGIKVGINLVILISVITAGIYSYKKANDDFLELGKAIKIGTIIAILGAIIPLVWNVLLMNVIEPEMINKIVDIRHKEVINFNPDMSQEEIDQSRALIEIVNSSYIKSALLLVSNLLFGFLIALMTGAIMQKKRNK